MSINGILFFYIILFKYPFEEKKISVAYFLCIARKLYIKKFHCIINISDLII